ncbi:long-chain acyl-CoA synthetase [Streptomyces sp. 846.5]|nr:long-chain acyl-CoA synthetase [Streptomyces sp. 846.5]
MKEDILLNPYAWSPWRTAAVDPRRPAVVVRDRSCSFGELTDRADEFSRTLLEYGVRDGELICSTLPPGPDFFALALACLRSGFGLLPVDREFLEGPDGLSTVQEAAPCLQVHENFGASDCPIFVRSQGLGPAAADDRPHPRLGVRSGYLAFVTSGTTGAPKVVVRNRPWYPYNGVAVMEKYAAGLGFGPHVMANPAFHLGTLGPALYALQAGSPVVVLDRWSVPRLIEVVDRYRAASLFLSPDLLLDVTASGQWPSHRPNVVFHAGAACPPGVKREAIRLMGPVLHEYYGTSEGIVSEITTSEWLEHPGSVGRPLPGVEVRIQTDGQEVHVGEPGSIMVRRRSVDQGNGAEHLADTGDLGYLDTGGYLHVLGRAGEQGSIERAQLEHQIRALQGVADAVLLHSHEQEQRGFSCYVETAGDRSALAQAIESLVAGTSKAVRTHIGPIGSFARTPSGKLHLSQIAGQDKERVGTGQ